MSDHIKDIVYSHKLLQYSNIIGFSDSLQKRIKDGKEVPDTECVRLYAQFKIDKQKLDPSGLVLSTFIVMNVIIAMR